MNSDYINIDPTDSNNLIIGDENKNLTFKSNQYIRFERNSIPENDEGFINLALGNGSGANTVVYDTQQQMENDTNVVDKMFAYRTDLNGLFIRINNEWKQISSVSVQDDGQGNVSFVTLNYAEKDKNEEIEGTWTFKENTTFEKNVNANQVITDTIHSNQFLSGSNGWRLQDDSLEIENLTVRNKLKTNVFEIDKIKATNGTLYVSNCTTLTYVGDEPEVSTRGVVETPQSPSNDFTGVTKYVTFRENVFEVGDIIQCHNLNKNYKAIVLASNQILLESDSIGSPAIEDEVVKIDSTVESRNGTVLLTSDLDNAPYVDIKKGNVTKVRLGNLSGIDEAEGYGLYSDNAYLKGTFKLSNGTTLVNYNDSSIRLSLGQMSSDLTGLGSRITLTENAIESLVIGDNLIYSSDPENEDLSTIKTRWNNNNLTFTDNYITHNSNNTSIYLLSKGTVSLLDNEELEFTIATKFDSDESGTNIAIAKLSIDSNGNYEIGNSVNIKKITGILHLKFTVGENKAVSNQYIYLHIIPNSTIDDYSFKFRNESLTRSIYSIIELSSSSINQQVTQNISGKLYQTGININGNNRSITVKTDNFKVTDSTGENVTFEIGNNGNLIAKNGAKIEGTLLIPYSFPHIPLSTQFIDLNNESNLKNYQIKPRVSDLLDPENGSYDMLVMILPGFDFILNESLYHDGQRTLYREEINELNEIPGTYVHVINKYGFGNEFISNNRPVDTYNESSGLELNIYHEYSPIYTYNGGDTLELKTDIDLTTVNTKDSVLDKSVLILADSKMSGNSNVPYEGELYLLDNAVNKLATRNLTKLVSSGWIITNKDIVKSVLLSPGYILTLKSVLLNDLRGMETDDQDPIYYHTNVWVVLNSEMFDIIDVNYVINCDNNDVLDFNLKMLICKDVFPKNNLNGKTLKLTLNYINNIYKDYRWELISQ